MLKLLSQITFEEYMYWLGYVFISNAIANFISSLNEIDAETPIIKSIIYSVAGLCLIFYFKAKI